MSNRSLVLFVTLVLGCSGGADQGTTTPIHIPPPRIVTPGDGLFGVASLRAACARVEGARFREHKKECECASLQFREEEGKLFSTVEGGSCLSLGRPDPLSLEPKCGGAEPLKNAYFDDGIDGMNRCLRNIGNFYNTHFGIQLTENVSARDALKLARQLDKERSKFYVKLWPTPEESFFNSSITVIAGQTRVNKDYIRQTLELPPTGEKFRVKVTYLEPDASRVLETLGHPLDPPLSLATPSDVLGDLQPLAKYMATVFAAILSENMSSNAPKEGGDCRRYCVLEQLFPEDASLKVRARRSKHYLAGVPYRDLVKFEDTTSSDTVGFLHLNFRGSVSAIFFVSRSWNKTDNAIQSRVRVFDRLWNQVGDETFSILENVSLQREKAAKIPVSDWIDRGVVLCDSVDLEKFEQHQLLDRIRIPTPSKEPESGLSFFGWLENRSNSLVRYTDAQTELIEGAVPRGRDDHGLEVSLTIHGSNEATKILPISFVACMKNYFQWKDSVQKAGVKIINLSGSYTFDRQWCEAFFPIREMMAGPFLWVTAAGNGGQKNPIDRCPQNVSIRDHLVVVAGGNEFGISEGSDFGVNYADIVADQRSATGSQGTSFASPRVAEVASEIAFLFGNLRPEKIRLAILAGASVPNWPLEVSSGGALNREYAIRAAEILSRPQTTGSAADLVTKVWNELWEPSETERRLKIWRARGLLS